MENYYHNGTWIHPRRNVYYFIPEQIDEGLESHEDDYIDVDNLFIDD
mgnify:CR=1 FL=1